MARFDHSEAATRRSYCPRNRWGRPDVLRCIACGGTWTYAQQDEFVAHLQARCPTTK